MKAAQSYCALCERLFCYFQTTKRRLYCTPCVAIERRVSNVFVAAEQRRRRAAQENA